MNFSEEYQAAKRLERLAQLRRMIALRAMVAIGTSQREIAAELGISQPAVSQQLKAASDLSNVHSEILLEAAAPILKRVAEDRGYTDLAVFGSVARDEARVDSDLGLLVTPAAGGSSSSLDFVGFKLLLERVLGCEVDLVSDRGLEPRLDDDIRRDAVSV